MQVIDAHQHLWDTSQLKYPWLEEPNTFRASYQLNDYHKAFGEIDIIKSVHVEADPGPGAEIAEVDMISRISSLEGTIGAIVAAAPLEIPSYFLDKLNVGGRLVAPIGNTEVQDLSLIKKIGKDKYETEVVEKVLFVPVLGGRVE